MKKSSLLLFVFFVSTLLIQAQSNKFRLEGTIVNYDSLKIRDLYINIFAYAEPNQYKIKETRVKIENSRFIFEGEINYPFFATFNTDNIRQGLGVWLTKDTIKADFQVSKSTNQSGEEKKILKTLLVHGSEESQEYLTFNYQNNIIYSQEKNPLKRNSLISELTENYLDNNRNSYLSLYKLMNTLNECGATKSQFLFDKLTDDLKKSVYGIATQTQIKTLEQNAVGNTIPDFSMPNQDGKKIKISSEIKGWTIINFWASWCGGCREENKYLVGNKTKFDAKSVKIVGVSFDSNKDAWVKAIEKDKVNWLQLSDLSGEFDSEIAQKFKIQSLPYIILVDKDLKILATEYNEIMKLIEAK